MMRAAVPTLLVLIWFAVSAHAQVINGETPYDNSMLDASNGSTGDIQRAAREAERRAEAERDARKLEDMLETSGSRPTALR
jgi:hypothetical protein